MWSSRLLLLIMALIGSSDAGVNTTWTISGTLICPIRQEFKYHLVIFEEDGPYPFPDADDRIGDSGWQVSKAPHQYSITAMDDGDGLGNYEVYAKIVHECTSDGTRRVIGVTLGDFRAVTRHYELRKHFDIADKGEFTGDI